MVEGGRGFRLHERYVTSTPGPWLPCCSGLVCHTRQGLKPWARGSCELLFLVIYLNVLY